MLTPMKPEQKKLVKKLLFSLAAFILTISLIQFIWLGYKTSFWLVKHLPSSYQKFFNVAHFKTRTNVIDIIDSFYPKTYLHSRYIKDLKKFDLIMSQSDINNIKADVDKAMELGYNDKNTVNKQAISLLYNQSEYPARISLHGGGANNHIFYKTDYNIKLENNQTIDNLSSFTLFNPSIHYWIIPQLTNQLAENLDLHYARQYPVKVNINSKNYGIYLLEEKINSEFLVNRSLSNAQIIKLKDETRLAHRGNIVALNAHHLSGLDFEIANVDSTDGITPSTLYRLNQLFKTIKNRQINNLPEFFNLDYLARFDAYREFFGVNHNTTGDNLAMFYSPQDRKFYPIVRSEGDLNRLSLEAGTTLKSFNDYDPHLEEQYNYPRLFLLLHHLPQFRILKYKYLNQIISDFPQLKKEFDEIYDKYADVFIYDTTDETSISRKKSLFKKYRNIINNNFNLIKRQLEFAQIAINVINQGRTVTVEIVPDSVMPVAFNSFELEFENLSETMDVTSEINQNIIITKFSNDFNLIPATYSYTFNVSSPVSSINLKAKNNITAKSIEAVYINIAGE